VSRRQAILLTAAAISGCSGRGGNGGAGTENAAAGGRSRSRSGRAPRLLNVSYDPTRELYAEYNRAFERYWLGKTGRTPDVQMSHGGSGSQARAVIDGLQADVVTLALAADIDAIAARARLLPRNWQSRLSDSSAPYTSTIIFLVRGGNPKGIHDWPDLLKPGISIVTPNPRTSGGARWNYMAAWGWALHQPGGSEATAKDFVRQIYKRVTVMDTGARGATNTFVQRGIGDVLLAWENEAYLSIRETGHEKVQIVVPREGILAEPAVAVVDKVAIRHGTVDLARAYLEYLYSAQAQEIIAKHYYRPRDAAVAARHVSEFPRLKLFTIAEFGGWGTVQQKHFAEGGVFDQITSG
jgi:sulfate transport system substrate-binding protein